MGKIVNMMATDATRSMQQAIELFIPLYILPLQFIIVFCILIGLLNYAMLAVVGVALLTLPVNIWIFLSLNKYQEQAVLLTDKRVKLINEILSGIRVVKFYSWEVPIFKQIDEAREFELTGIRKLANFAMIGLMTVFTQMPSLLQCAALITYALLGGDINPFIIFTALPYFQQLQTPLSQLPNAFTVLVQRRIALDRITSYLKQEEIDSSGLSRGGGGGDGGDGEGGTGGGGERRIGGGRGGEGGGVAISRGGDDNYCISIVNGEFTWSSEVRDAAAQCGSNIEGRLKYITNSRENKYKLKQATEKKKKILEKNNNIDGKNDNNIEDLISKENNNMILEYSDALSSLSCINLNIKSGKNHLKLLLFNHLKLYFLIT